MLQAMKLLALGEPWEGTGPRNGPDPVKQAGNLQKLLAIMKESATLASNLRKVVQFGAIAGREENSSLVTPWQLRFPQRLPMYPFKRMHESSID